MLADLIEIKRGDIISLTGAGGKTMAMFFLAQQLKNKKILVTTTTKIFLPDKNFYDYYGLGSEKLLEMNNNKANGIYLAAKKINEENKLSGFEQETLAEAAQNYDIVIIESDGAKRKLLKGWRGDEPVIIKNTTKTVGIINFKLLGQPINAENIHRVEEYARLTGADLNTPVTLEQLQLLVLQPQGLFKNAQGEKTLYINMVETNEDQKTAAGFIRLFSSRQLTYLDKVIMGSFDLRRFERIV